MSPIVEKPTVRWEEAGSQRSALWLSESRVTPPARVIAGDDSLKADLAYRYACEGTAVVWRGDFENAKQLSSAVSRRFDHGRARRRAERPAAPSDTFHRHRMEAAQRARALGMILIELEPDYSVPLRRAPDIRAAVTEVYGPGRAPALVPLRDLLGMIGAREWRRRGIFVEALGARVFPHYGVFAPIRSEYVELVASARLPSTESAFDIGTGTGVLAALLARRGIARVIATDIEPRAVACAEENLARLGFGGRTTVLRADLFPPEELAPRASLIVCNPPWLPAKATTRLERAVYDQKSRMLRGFLRALPRRLAPGGEAWLLMSDLAEHLGLRGPTALRDVFEEAGLRVKAKTDARPTHPRIEDRDDPLHEARKAETISLWRLVP